jgi:hypothetical protein
MGGGGVVGTGSMDGSQLFFYLYICATPAHNRLTTLASCFLAALNRSVISVNRDR